MLAENVCGWREITATNTAENHLPAESAKSHRPMATPETRQREKLMRDLGYRLFDLQALQPNWDGEGASPVALEVLKKAYDLGREIIGTMDPLPQALNISASTDGFVLFSLFGFDGREVDLWVEDASGRVRYVATERDTEEEAALPIAGFARLGEWLAGRRPAI